MSDTQKHNLFNLRLHWQLAGGRPGRAGVAAAPAAAAAAVSRSSNSQLLPR